MTEEVEDESIFFLAEAVTPAASAGGIGLLESGRNNRTDGAEANDAPILLLGHTSNLRLEDMVELRCQWITTNYDNYTAP